MCQNFPRLQEIMDELERRRSPITTVCEQFVLGVEMYLKESQAEFGTSSSSIEEMKQIYAMELDGSVALSRRCVQKSSSSMIAFLLHFQTSAHTLVFFFF